MKKIIFLLAVIFASVSCNKVDINVEKSNVEAAIKGFYASIEKLDYESISTFCTPTLTGFEAGTSYPDIKSFIDLLKSFELQSCTFNVNIIKTEVVGDMAYAVIDFQGKMTSTKNVFGVKAAENHILKKVNGKWRIDYFHSTHLSDDPVLAKGSFLGLHVIKGITLKPGVTMEQAKEYLVNTYIPGFNKLSSYIKLVALKGIRGTEKDQMGIVYYFASEDVRNRLMEDDGKLTPAGEEYLKKFAALNAEADKLYTIDKIIYTDWVVK